MALASGTVWEVRVGGVATNGAGYNSARAGATTDYSRQTGPQFSYTDLVIGAANSVTSAAFPFTTLAIGNLLQIASGVNFTPDYYEVTNVVGVTATLDKSPGTLAAASGVGKLGGAAPLLSTIATKVVGGNVIWIQAGAGFAPAVTQTLSAAGADNAPITWAGYTTTRGDAGRATFTWAGAANGTVIDLTGAQNLIRNVLVDGNAKSADRGLRLNAANCVGINCHAKACNLTGLESINAGTMLLRCSATTTGTSTGSAGIQCGSGGIAHSCVAYANTKNGFAVSNSGVTLINCIARGNTTNGFYVAGAGSMGLYNCVSYGNTVDGLRLDGTPEDSLENIFNTIFAANGGYGVNATGADYTVAANAQMPLARRWNNAFYLNTLGARNQWPAGNNEVTLTADPFTSAATFDFSLNGTAGGGAALRGLGLPGGFGLLGTSAENSLGYSDIGAVQGLAGAGSGGGIGDAASLRTLWRELTNEFSTTVVPDSVVDLYLNGGLQALNRRVHYHLTDTTSAVTLVAATQEYDLPSDCVFVAWVQWNGREIPKSDTDEWRRRDVDWRNAKAGSPQEWAHYRNRIIFYPAPDANAVAASATPLLRYVSTPPDFTVSGAEQLALQDRRIIVYFAVAEWANAHPDSALATIRAEAFEQRFEQEAEAVKGDYLARMVGR